MTDVALLHTLFSLSALALNQHVAVCYQIRTLYTLNSDKNTGAPTVYTGAKRDLFWLFLVQRIGLRATCRKCKRCFIPDCVSLCLSVSLSLSLSVCVCVLIGVDIVSYGAFNKFYRSSD